MSQPAVSNALKRLRLSFGDALFVRTRTGLVPTERALQLHALIAPALDLVKQSYDKDTFDPSASDRLINISMNSTIENLVLASFIRPLRSAAPFLRFRVYPDQLPNIPARLREGRLQYAIEYVKLPPEHYDSLLLSKDKLSVVCATDHPILKSRISLKQYQNLPHLAVSPRSSMHLSENSGELTPVEQILGANLPTRNVAMHVTSLLSIPSIVAATDLIATLGDAVSRPWVDRREVKVLKPPFDIEEYELRLYWHKSRTNDACHLWLVDQFRALIDVLEQN